MSKGFFPSVLYKLFLKLYPSSAGALLLLLMSVFKHYHFLLSPAYIHGVAEAGEGCVCCACEVGSAELANTFAGHFSEKGVAYYTDLIFV